jgi:DNA-binding MurR/RpiR family transcriptional regulator
MTELVRSIEQVRITLNAQSVQALLEQIDCSRRVVILAEAPALPAAYNLVYFLEQGGFSVYVARPGVVDLARTVHIATPFDLLLSIDVSGQSPYIAGALCEAQKKGIPTAAIVGAGSIASARSASIVLEAPAHPSLGVSIVAIEAVIFVLGQCLHWKFEDRYRGVEHDISELTRVIQQPSD